MTNLTKLYFVNEHRETLIISLFKVSDTKHHTMN